MDTDSALLIAVAIIIAAVLSLCGYGFHLNQECRLAGVQAHYAAVEIQAICR